MKKRNKHASRVLRIFLSVLIMGSVLFIASGEWGWISAWIHIGVALLNYIVIISLINRDLLEERSSFKPDAKEWDKKLVHLLGWFFPLTISIVIGLDRRFGWSPEIDPVIRWAALGLEIVSLTISDWAVLSNRFFSAYVRIQTDRGHRVIDSGPYRFVRHPGYAAGIFTYICICIFLGSLWTLLLVFLFIGLVGYRTAKEDRTLQEELSGYREYAGKVRFRLFPGIW